jgi:MFS family permease
VSAIGTQVSGFAFPLFVLALTKSPEQAGFVASLGALPYVVFSLPAGALVDRWDRKRVMILCDTARALSLGSIPLTVLISISLRQMYSSSHWSWRSFRPLAQSMVLCNSVIG